MSRWPLRLWHMPGRLWSGMMKAAPVTVWARFGGALSVSVGIAVLVAVIWLGRWSLAVEAARLDWLGLYGVLLILALIVCIVALFDFKLNFSASRSGISANMAGDDDPLPPPVTPPASEKP